MDYNKTQEYIDELYAINQDAKKTAKSYNDFVKHQSKQLHQFEQLNTRIESRVSYMQGIFDKNFYLSEGVNNKLQSLLDRQQKLWRITIKVFISFMLILGIGSFGFYFLSKHVKDKYFELLAIKKAIKSHPVTLDFKGDPYVKIVPNSAKTFQYNQGKSTGTFAKVDPLEFDNASVESTNKTH